MVIRLIHEHQRTKKAAPLGTEASSKRPRKEVKNMAVLPLAIRTEVLYNVPVLKADGAL